MTAAAVTQYARNGGRFSGFEAACKLLILVLPAALAAADKPDTRAILKQVAANGTRFEAELANYTYRQSFRFFEFDRHGNPGGRYDEVRDVTLTPEGERLETFVKGPINRLNRIKLTEEDFRDIREIQPFVLTEETLWLYETRYEGDQRFQERDCWVFRIRPRQILEGQRFLDGRIWVDKETNQALQVAGLPVPQLYRIEGSNLFPKFVTVYKQIDGKYWFPVSTIADDTLAFSSGAQKVRYEIEFTEYKRFQAESSITFAK